MHRRQLFLRTLPAIAAACALPASALPQEHPPTAGAVVSPENAAEIVFSFGSASGGNGAEIAARQAMDDPLLERRLAQASHVLLAVVAPKGVLKLRDTKAAMRSVREQMHPHASLVCSAAYHNAGDDITVCVIASGFQTS